jgi:phage gp46-like protein
MAVVEDRVTIWSHEASGFVAALDQDLVRRMRNWADWKGGGGFHTASGFLTEYGSRFDRYREARMPVLIAEAEQTNRAILALPENLGAAVALFWLTDATASFSWIAGQLGCTHPTAKAWILEGHKLLASVCMAMRRDADEALTVRLAHDEAARVVRAATLSEDRGELYRPLPISPARPPTRAEFDELE